MARAAAPACRFWSVRAVAEDRPEPAGAPGHRRGAIAHRRPRPDGHRHRPRRHRPCRNLGPGRSRPAAGLRNGRWRWRMSWPAGASSISTGLAMPSPRGRYRGPRAEAAARDACGTVRLPAGRLPFARDRSAHRRLERRGLVHRHRAGLPHRRRRRRRAAVPLRGAQPHRGRPRRQPDPDAHGRRPVQRLLPPGRPRGAGAGGHADRRAADRRAKRCSWRWRRTARAATWTCC